MGQISCQCGQSDNRITHLPKCSLLNQQLLSQFQLPDKQNFQYNHKMTSSWAPQSNKLPIKYLDLFMMLRCTHKKFVDLFYNYQMFTTQDNKWQRISQNNNKNKIVTANRNMYNVNEQSSISKFCKMLNFIIKNYKDLIQKIKPIYMQKVGMAICKLYINGTKMQVLIDDYVPKQKLSYQVQQNWVLLLEKAMSKVLGDYKYIEEFTIGELFGEMTGIPYNNIKSSTFQLDSNSHPNSHITIKQHNTTIHNKHTNFNNFKQALKCDQLLFQTKRFNTEQQIFQYRKNYMISNISFTSFKYKNTIIKITNTVKQNISLRIIQPSIKYKQSNNLSQIIHQYPELLVQCYHEKNGEYRKYCNSYRYKNYTYLQNIFIDMEQGIYWLYIKQFGQERQPLNIVSYSKSPIKFTQIFSMNSTNFSPIFSQLTNINPKQSTKSTFVKIQNLQQIKVIIKNNKIFMCFTESYKNKILRLCQQNFYFIVQGDNKQNKQIQLDNIASKVVVLIGCTEWDINQFDLNQYVKIYNR